MGFKPRTPGEVQIASTLPDIRHNGLALAYEELFRYHDAQAVVAMMKADSVTTYRDGRPGLIVVSLVSVEPVLDHEDAGEVHRLIERARLRRLGTDPNQLNLNV